MAKETVPPEVVALINNMRRRIADLERRLLAAQAAGLQLVGTDFKCIDLTDMVGSIAVPITSHGGGDCGSGYTGTAYAPLFVLAD